MFRIFRDFDLKNFWDDSDDAREEYVEKRPTPALIASVEKELGYKLPASYVELMQSQNGGIPRNTCFPTKTPTSWAEDHVAVTGILGIGRTKTYSLCGELGSKFMQEEWGYPDIGICVCDCPSAGHDMIMLDYRKTGEPRVVHVDQESDYKITPLAKDFETFVRGLVPASVYDTSAEDLKKDLAAIDTGDFSKLLAGLIARHRETDFGPILRNLARAIATEKGYFALHADEKSHLMYDVQFLLYTRARSVKDAAAYLRAYPGMIAMVEGGFSTGGYAEDFVKEWLAKRCKQRAIVTTPKGGLAFSPSFLKTLRARLRAFQ